MNTILVPAFLDAETAHRRERITREWGRAWFSQRRGTELARRGGLGRTSVVATDHAVVAAR